MSKKLLSDTLENGSLAETAQDVLMFCAGSTLFGKRFGALSRALPSFYIVDAPELVSMGDVIVSNGMVFISKEKAIKIAAEEEKLQMSGLEIAYLAGVAMNHARLLGGEVKNCLESAVAVVSKSSNFKGICPSLCSLVIKEVSKEDLLKAIEGYPESHELLKSYDHFNPRNRTDMLLEIMQEISDRSRFPELVDEFTQLGLRSGVLIGQAQSEIKNQSPIQKQKKLLSDSQENESLLDTMQDILSYIRSSQIFDKCVENRFGCLSSYMPFYVVDAKEVTQFGDMVISNGMAFLSKETAIRLLEEEANGSVEAIIPAILTGSAIVQAKLLGGELADKVKLVERVMELSNVGKMSDSIKRLKITEVDKESFLAAIIDYPETQALFAEYDPFNPEDLTENLIALTQNMKGQKFKEINDEFSKIGITSGKLISGAFGPIVANEDASMSRPRP